MADNTTQVSEQINSAVNNALGVGALAAIYTGNFVNIGINKKGGASEVSLIEKTITENGVYTAADDGADGYSEVTVNVESDLTEKTITENGVYTAADDGADGYSKVTVNVESESTGIPVIPDIKHGRLGGYVSVNTWAAPADYDVINSVYEITPGHEYLYYLGTNIGNRLVISVFDKDPTSLGTTYAGRNIVDRDNPSAHTTTYFAAGEGETHMVVLLDFESVEDCNGYLLDITDLEV